MTTKKNIDRNGIEYKQIELDQFDDYDYDFMANQLQRYNKRIGSIMIIFNELEHTLDKAISFMVFDDCDDLGYRIIMDLTFRQKVDLFFRFCKSFLVLSEKKSDLPIFNKLISDLISAGEIRNIIAHAKWMSLDNDGFVRSKSSIDTDAYIQFKCYKLTPSILYSLERKISKTDSKLYSFLEANNLC